MASRAFVFLGLLFAIVVVLVSSAAEVEKSQDENAEGGVGRFSCNHGCCHSGRWGCYRCCASAEEAKAYNLQVADSKDNLGSASEEAEATTSQQVADNKDGNRGPAIGRGCHRCCSRGGCRICCHGAEGANGFKENEVKP